MAEIPPVVGTVSVDVEHPLAPHKAQIIDGALPHLRYAVGVTEEHGVQVEELRVDPVDLNDHPYRPHGERTVADVDSFLLELGRRELDDSGTLWGSVDRGHIVAIYNDHTNDDPGWRDDKLNLSLTADADWQAWHAMSGQFYDQNTFGDKIEERLHTIIRPDQADLLEVIDSIRASTSGEFESGIERSNGGQRLVYKQEHTVKAGRAGQLEVPQFILLELRPWEGHAEIYGVQAYFRVRVKDGVLALGIKLKPTRQILREAWSDLTDKVTDSVGKPVYAVK